MSQKHFKQLAAGLAKAKPLVPDGADAEALTVQEYRARCTKEVQWKNDVVAIAEVLAGFNARFDRIRFYRACGVEIR